MFNEIKSLQGAPLHTISSCVSSVRRRYDIYIYNTSIIRLLCSYYEFSLGHWPWSPHTGRSLYLTHTYIYIFITYTAIVGTILYYYYYYAYEYNNILVYTSTQCDGVGFYFPISPRAHTHTRACLFLRSLETMFAECVFVFHAFPRYIISIITSR